MIETTADHGSIDRVRDGLEHIYPKLWRFAKLTAGNVTDAQDLLQDTCERAINKAHLYKPDGKLESWVYKIMRRLWLNTIRSQNSRVDVNQKVDVETMTSDKVSMEKSVFVNQVLRLIETLPEAQRQTVYLVYVEGFKYAEAADILSVPVGTIMSRLSNARKQISEIAG